MTKKGFAEAARKLARAVAAYDNPKLGDDDDPMMTPDGADEYDEMMAALREFEKVDS